MFQICLGRNACSSRMFLYSVKNRSTFGLLKPIALERFVPCGILMDRSGYLLKNPLSQSLPAHFVTVLNGCFSLYVSAISKASFLTSLTHNPYIERSIHFM